MLNAINFPQGTSYTTNTPLWNGTQDLYRLANLAVSPFGGLNNVTGVSPVSPLLYGQNPLASLMGTLPGTSFGAPYASSIASPIYTGLQELASLCGINQGLGQNCLVNTLTNPLVNSLANPFASIYGDKSALINPALVNPALVNPLASLTNPALTNPFTASLVNPWTASSLNHALAHVLGANPLTANPLAVGPLANVLGTAPFAGTEITALLSAAFNAGIQAGIQTGIQTGVQTGLTSAINTVLPQLGYAASPFAHAAGLGYGAPLGINAPFGINAPLGLSPINAPFGVQVGVQGLSPIAQQLNGAVSGISPLNYNALNTPVNFIDNDHEFIIECVIPGVDIKNTSVTVVGPEIRIRPQANCATSGVNAGFISLPLPGMVDISAIKANVKDGILKIVLPKIKSVTETIRQIKVA